MHANLQLSTAGIDSLIDAYLSQQRELTAVEQFSRRHDVSHNDGPAQARYYRDLIPLTAPVPGEQYAFEVDLDACSGCKACVTACHSLNGLDADELWRNVGLLVGHANGLPILQHVTTACHHCVEPACMDGCPVKAYEKDDVTGIVRHLDDQCIGCQYCILKCPYDVPKYNKKKGIVRKCDMCSSRLAEGEAPACVQACPNQAIRIRITSTQKIVEDAEGKTFLPGTRELDYTLPTTQYKTTRPILRNTLPADYFEVTPEHAHLPLVVMLVLTQLSVGTFVVGQVLAWLNWTISQPMLRSLQALVALTVGVLALSASVLHLGRPLYAFRVIIGLRTSWLSREILAFGIFAVLASAYALCCWQMPVFVTPRRLNLLGTAVACSGLLGVFCSVMIYRDTRREFWRARLTATSFLLTTLLLGLATTLLTTIIGAAWSRDLQMAQAVRGWGSGACVLMACVAAIKLCLALLTLRHLRGRLNTPMKRTARLLVSSLFRPAMARIALLVIGGVLLPLIAPSAIGARQFNPIDCAILMGAGFAMTVASELLERYLFFAAVVAPKMPGGLGS